MFLRTIQCIKTSFEALFTLQLSRLAIVTVNFLSSSNTPISSTLLDISLHQRSPILPNHDPSPSSIRLPWRLPCFQSIFWKAYLYVKSLSWLSLKNTLPLTASTLSLLLFDKYMWYREHSKYLRQNTTKLRFTRIPLSSLNT